MCNAENKQELFAFLATNIPTSEFSPGKEVVTTYGEGVLVRGSNRSMPACNHEEADTRIVYHIKDSLQQGYECCLICTLDTDVVVIRTGKFHQLQEFCLNADIWVAFDTGRTFLTST